MEDREIAKEIVVAALQNAYIYKSDSNEKTAKEIAKVFKEIYAAVNNPRD